MAQCRYPPGWRNCLCHGHGLRTGAQSPPGHLGWQGIGSSRDISSLFTARSPWRRWPCPREGQGLAPAQGRYQWSSSAQLLPGSCPSCDWALTHKVDTPAYPADSGKGANKGRVADEAVVQRMEQMPIPGCIMGVACMPRAIVGKPSGQ